MRKVSVILSILLILFSLNACSLSSVSPTGNGNTDPNSGDTETSDSGENSGNEGNENTGNNENTDPNSGDTETSDSGDDNDNGNEDGSETESNEGTNTSEDTVDTPSNTCPDPAIPASITFSHHIEQNYMGNNMTGVMSGSIPIIIGTQGITGTGTLSNTLTGVFPEGGCTMNGTRSVDISINGTCSDGVLDINLVEDYLQSTMTICGASVPMLATTNSHDISLSLEDGATYSAPFSGDAGSGTYNWTLSLF